MEAIHRSQAKKQGIKGPDLLDRKDAIGWLAE
jgi:hypothetical protein